jgi:CHAT domain-containing protein
MRLCPSWLLVALLLPAVYASPVAPPQAPAPDRDVSRRQRDGLQKEANSLWEKGKRAEALAAAERKIVLERDVFGELSDEVIASLRSLAWHYAEQGDYTKAQVTGGEAVAVVAELRGLWNADFNDTWLDLDRFERLARLPQDPRQRLLAALRNYDQAASLTRDGRLLEATSAIRSALRIQDELEPDTFSTAASRVALGLLCLKLNDPAQAERPIREALRVFDRLLVPDHARHVQARELLADVLDQLAARHIESGANEPARAERRELLELLTGLFGPKNWQVVSARLALRYVDRVASLDARQQAQLVEQRRLTRASNGLLERRDLAHALASLRRAAEISLAVFGENDYEYAVSLVNLGLVWSRLSDTRKAESALRRAITILRANGLPDDHPVFRQARTILANVLTQKVNDDDARADHDGALQAGRELAEVMESLFGKDDWRAVDARWTVRRVQQRVPLTAVDRQRLNEADRLTRNAIKLASSGAYDETVGPLRRALEIRGQILGENSYDYASSLQSLGQVFLSLGDFRRAEVPLRKAWLFERNATPKDHPNRQSVTSSLSLVLGRLADEAMFNGDLGRSHELSRERFNLLMDLPAGAQWQAVDTRQHEARSDRLARLRTDQRKAISEAYSLIGGAGDQFQRKQEKRAVELAAKAVQLIKQAVGEKHEEYAEGLLILASAYYSADDAAHAAPRAQKAAEIFAESLGSESPEYAASLDGLGQILAAIGDLKGAAEALRTAADVRHRSLGPGHPQTVLTQNRLAEVYRRSGDSSAALRVGRESLEGIRLWLGESSTDYARELIGLAFVGNSVGNLEYVASSLRSAAEIVKASSGVDPTSVLAKTQDFLSGALGSLANDYANRGEWAAARGTQEELILALGRTFGAAHWRIRDARRVLANFDRVSRLPDSKARRVSEALRIGLELKGYIEKRMLSRAVKEAEKARDLIEDTMGKEAPELLGPLVNLALVHSENGAMTKAIEFLEQAKALARRSASEESLEYAQVLKLLGSFYVDAYACGAARPLLVDAEKLSRHVYGEDHPYYAETLTALGSLEQAEANYPVAEAHYRRALAILEQAFGRGGLQYAKGLERLGDLFDESADFARAEPLLRQALAIRDALQKENDSEHLASLERLADLYIDMGDADRAEPYLLRSADISRRSDGEDSVSYAQSLTALGELSLAKGEPERAVDWLSRALKIFEKVADADDPVVADARLSLAEAHMARRDFDNAAQELNRASAFYETKLGKESAEYLDTLLTRATLESMRARYDVAEMLAREAVRSAKHLLGDKDVTYLESELLLGLIEHARGFDDRAGPRLERVVSNWKTTRGEQSIDAALPLFALAAVDRSEGRLDAALRSVDEAMRAEQAQAEQLFASLSEAAMLAFLGTLDHRLDLIITIAAAESSRAGPATEAALNWTLRRKAIVLDTLIRRRALLKSLEHDPAFAEKLASLRVVRQHLADLPLNPPDGVQQATIDRQRATWQAQAERLDGEVNSALVGRRGKNRDEPPIDAAVVRSHLPKGSALVEFVRAEPCGVEVLAGLQPAKPARYFAFVLRSGAAAAQLIDMGDAREIDDEIIIVRGRIESAARSLRLNYEKTVEARFVEDASRLYRRVFARLFDPLCEALGNDALIYLAPDGELNRLPFEALVDGRGRYLIESLRIAYVSSGRDLVPNNCITARGTVIFAGPKYSLEIAEREEMVERQAVRSKQSQDAPFRSVRPRGTGGLRWDPLPGARAEAIVVRDALSGSAYAPVHEPFEGRGALEESFKAIQAPRVLHVATHGFFLPNQRSASRPSVLVSPRPRRGEGAGWGLGRLEVAENPLLRSGLVLAGANAVGQPRDLAAAEVNDDGWLTAEEVAAMDLRGTELVVLSACDSGLGDVRAGEGVYGLRRAFQTAGTKALVMSLFDAPDDETRQLMERFYKAVASGKEMLQALQEGRRSILEERRRTVGAAHPLFWAGFVLVGGVDPR